MQKLSPHQTAIGRLVGLVYCNRDIAAELKTSEQAVKSALHAIFDKLGVGNRVELVNRLTPEIDRNAVLTRLEHGRREVLATLSTETVSQKQLDDVVYVAATLCSTPISILTIMEADRVCFRSTLGIKANGTPRKGSFCDCSIQGCRLFEVQDAAQDSRFCNHPYVISDPHIRFYAAVPMLTADGYAIGNLCVLDSQRRTLTKSQRE